MRILAILVYTFISVIHLQAQSQEVWTVFNTSNSSLTFNRISDFEFDSHGHIWALSHPWDSSTGLAILDDSTWTVFDLTDGIYANNFNDMTIDNSDTKWIASHQGGVFRFDGINWSHYTAENSDLPSNNINCIAADSTDVIWIGTDGGLTRYDGVTWTIYNELNSAILANNIISIGIDSDNHVWAYTMNGLTEIDGNDIVTYPAAFNNFSFGNALVIDQENTKWISAGYGIKSFDGTEWNYINYFETGSSCISDCQVLCLLTDDQDRLWAGMERECNNGGALNFSDCQTYTFENSPIPSYSVYAIKQDQQGAYWFGTANGIAKLEFLNANTPGCTDPTACNFSASATNDDGTCTYPGCLDAEALNYDPQAGCDGGNCVYTSSFIISPSNTNACLCEGSVSFNPSSALSFSVQLFDSNDIPIQSFSNLTGGAQISNLCPTVYHLVVTYSDGTIEDDYFEIAAGAVSTGDAHRVILCRENYNQGGSFIPYDLTPELSTFAPGGIWYDPNLILIPASELSNLNALELVSGWYTYVTQSGDCEVTTGIYLQGNNAGLSTTYLICETYFPFEMEDYMTGLIDTIGQWYDSSNQSVPLGIYSPAIMDSGVFTYVISNLEGCAPLVSWMNISEQQQQSAGLSNSLVMCEADTILSVFDLILGTPDSGGTWQLPSGASSAAETIILEATPSVSGTYVYSVSSGAPCYSQTANIDILIEAYGCMDSLACNYNPLAGCDDGGCSYLQGAINGPQLVFELEENTFEFPCDQGCSYNWSISNLAGTSTEPAIVLGNSNDCEVIFAWGSNTGIASVQLQVTCENGCESSYAYPIQIDTDILEKTNTPVLVYPNPAEDILTLSAPSAWLGADIRIIGMLGNIIAETTLSHVQQEIDCTAWEAGIYSIELHKDGAKSNAILVKQ